jgi:hypothetical protein
VTRTFQAAELARSECKMHQVFRKVRICRLGSDARFHSRSACGKIVNKSTLFNYSVRAEFGLDELVGCPDSVFSGSRTARINAQGRDCRTPASQPHLSCKGTSHHLDDITWKCNNGSFDNFGDVSAYPPCFPITHFLLGGMLTPCSVRAYVSLPHSSLNQWALDFEVSLNGPMSSNTHWFKLGQSWPYFDQH